ncbi:hypothetical protein NX059_004237 [Plenodomus lindquistii]|nr:hypothetical protein NX059_004237 [Plenodomus lindquistii]
MSTQLYTTTTKPSPFSKLNPFRKSSTSSTPTSDTASEAKTCLITQTSEDVAAHQKEKELIMKHRKMTEEEAETYMREKKDGHGLGTQKRLNAFAWAVAPIRI